MKNIIKKISLVSAIFINFIYSKVLASIDPGLVIDPPRTPITIAEASGWWFVLKRFIIPIIFAVLSIKYFKKNSSCVLKKIIIIAAIGLLLFVICCWLDNILIKEMTIYMYE